MAETKRRSSGAVRTRRLLACALIPVLLLCAACGGAGTNPGGQGEPNAVAARYLTAVEERPDTVDFQCTTIHYTVATNVFDRLVETQADGEGGLTIVPSLAESWKESDDGRTYTFHLREGVTFSNGSPLTSSDVLYTFTRLLTHPDSSNQDIAEVILGARKLEAGETDRLEGFEAQGDLDFSITLEQPYEGFLSCLSMPGASILDEETTKAAGDSFGNDAKSTIGTGPFVLEEWDHEKGMLFKANPTCWAGAPKCAGLDLRFIAEPEEIRAQFEDGQLDILDLDELGSSAEFYVHGDIYQNRIQEVPQIGITYIALNESVGPLDDVRVRKALQLALDRSTLLEAVYNGLGKVENGIFPHGLYGFNQDLPQIPFDPSEARRLLEEAGYADGFDLKFSVKSSSTEREMALADNVVKMWGDVGVRATVDVVDEDEFMRLRKGGELACYAATWTADFDDPDNFISTFFGSSANTKNRSLCYPKEDVMGRVVGARAIVDPEKRLKEYQDLERLIIQEDAAWVPLFSRTRLYVTSERLDGFTHAWNGSVKNVYSKMAVSDT